MLRSNCGVCSNSIACVYVATAETLFIADEDGIIY